MYSGPALNRTGRDRGKWFGSNNIRCTRDPVPSIFEFWPDRFMKYFQYITSDRKEDLYLCIYLYAFHKFLEKKNIYDFHKLIRTEIVYVTKLNKQIW